MINNNITKTFNDSAVGDKMAIIEIHNFGPIKDCKLDISDTNFMVLTGRQASGKSTLVKCIFFFRTVKELLRDSLRKYALDGENLFDDSHYTDFAGFFRTALRTRFLELFGSSQNMEKTMRVRYEYVKDTYITIEVEDRKFKNTGFTVNNYLNVDFGDPIYSFLKRIKSPIDSKKLKELKEEFENIIDDPYTTYFVPAGRCLMSLLTSQLNYFMVSMDDNQKRMMDYCTLKFIEIISKLKDMIAAGIDNVFSQYVDEKDYDIYMNTLSLMRNRMKVLLKGEYRIINGEERLYIDGDDEKFVKINYASSGQQEILWILNLLYFIIASKTKAFIIIEEPESHLYPDAQKAIMELISIVANNGCQIITTTHSPYVLGALNNHKFASYLANDTRIRDEVYNIIPQEICLKSLDAYYVKDGIISSCLEDMDGDLIDNTVIDEASQFINNDLDDLFELYSKLSESEE